LIELSKLQNILHVGCVKSPVFSNLIFLTTHLFEAQSWISDSCSVAKPVLVAGLEEQMIHFHPVVSEAFSGKNWVQICSGQHHSVALDSEGEFLLS
jgi:hypothetical protein